MVIQEYYGTRSDGVRLIRSYSNRNLYIQNAQGVNYAEAIDPENMGRLYIETNIPIENPPNEGDEISPEEALNIILGGE